MSKSSASVAVSVLFNVAIWVAPGIPDRYRFPIFYCTLALLVVACVYWVIVHLPAHRHAGGTPTEHIAPVNLSQKPLTGIWLRDECDKWLTLGNTVLAKLKTEGANGISEAKAWIDGVEKFSRVNLSLSDYDKINAMHPSMETFYEEKLKVEPAYETEMYKTIVGERGARLMTFRDKIK